MKFNLALYQIAAGNGGPMLKFTSPVRLKLYSAHFGGAVVVFVRSALPPVSDLVLQPNMLTNAPDTPKQQRKPRYAYAPAVKQATARYQSTPTRPIGSGAAGLPARLAQNSPRRPPSSLKKVPRSVLSLGVKTGGSVPAFASPVRLKTPRGGKKRLYDRYISANTENAAICFPATDCESVGQSKPMLDAKGLGKQCTIVVFNPTACYEQLCILKPHAMPRNRNYPIVSNSRPMQLTRKQSPRLVE